jgi:6-phosphogluconolactonase
MAFEPGSVGKTGATLALVGFLALAAAILPQAARAAAKTLPAARSYFVYVASGSKGIYNYRFDPKTGQVTPMGVVAPALPALSFLTTDPRHRFLYAVTERGHAAGADPSKTEGLVISYSIDPKTGALKLLNQVDSAGRGPCFVLVDDSGKTLFVANYGSGSVTSFAINADGSIGKKTGFDQHTGSGPNRERQEGPHAHATVLSPDNRFLFVPNLGIDEIKIYKFDAAKGTFTPNDPSFASVTAGLGPRHLVFGRGGKFAYVVCEMGSSVVVFSYDPVKGSLTPVQTISNLPSDFTGIDNSAEIEVGRSGRFLYASNRGSDSITVFAIDPSKGTLTRVQVAPTLGKIPRNFDIDPTGKYLIAGNQISNQLVVFAIDQTNGQLKPTGQVLDIAAPVCILFVPGT